MTAVTARRPQFCCPLNTDQLTIWGMLARSLLACLLVIAMGCENHTVQSAAPTHTPRIVALPTATEIFNLRSKCAELGDKILENNFVGRALTQEVKSHYNPETNRCYVELDVHAADLSKYEEYENSRYLFDGQTKDMLASSRQEKGVKSGSIYDPDDVTAGYDKANAMIDSRMADGRKQ